MENLSASERPTTMEQLGKTAIQVLWIVVPILGMLMNTGVLLRLRRMAKEDWERFETSCAFTLAAMSLSDIICLLALLCQVIFMHIGSSTLWSSVNDTVLVVFCKLSLYIMHATSAFSMWCWLLLSAIRFVAVYKPIVYRVMWSGPRKALLTLVAACVALEAWILRYATYDADALACYHEQTPALDSILHMFEITWSYVVPLVLIIACDSFVLCRDHSSGQFISEFTGKRIESRPARGTIIAAGGTVEKSEEELLKYQSRSARWRRKVPLQRSLRSLQKRHSSSAATWANERTQKKLLHRCILLTLVNLGMNLPSYALRVYGILDLTLLSSTTHFYLEMVSQSLYFGQFSCNAIYLVMLVYAQDQHRDKAKPSSRPSSRNDTQTHTFKPFLQL
uniref:G-protein coupled receptors family 1 profile domain-containing protein n=1 Tax=Plectus sambesii TaxID=2011161 RepID=A0A914VBR7_9BILA